MTNRLRSMWLASLAGLLALAAPAPPAPWGAVPALAQFGNTPAPAELLKADAAPVTVAAGGRGTVVVRLRVLDTWHVNANPAATEYLIPTEVSLAGAAGIAAGAPQYPEPKQAKLGFDETPLLVYDGVAEVRLPVTVAAGAANGPRTLRGKVGFQACNDQVCLAPASVPFEVVVTVTGGVAGATGAEAGSPAGGTPGDGAAGGPGEPDGSDSVGAAGGAGPAPGGGFETAPPPGSRAAAAVAANPLAERLSRGGLWGFLTVFLIGLALNLTPCVYPMLGVTVSIFGASATARPAPGTPVGTTPAAGTMPASGMAVGAGTTPAAGMAAPARPRGPTLQVFGLALTYVLGMAIMYSALGLVAALTGGLFGGFLQNPVVLLGIGVLMIALSLSMFGLYEFQPPAWLLERAGGTTGTSVLGVFLSGLVVGVFAAPCVGPPVVALLAVVGARGDPWFGFATFFTLAMGLGFPYLVLGTFSGLISSLPRSGDWMEWVKKVFGVILVAVGLFYALLAFAPKQAALVVPAALVLGGVYLGFFEKSGAKKPGFAWLKRVAGTGAVIAGVVMWSGMQAKGIEFRAATEADLDAALAAGRPVMIDFSADWCVPCHELDNFTFTDRRVIAAARDFVAFKVDLTRYDSPEAERWRRRYEITGVPTIVFLGRGGEVRGARVEGFLPAGPFLERMELAQATAEPAAAN